MRRIWLALACVLATGPAWAQSTIPTTNLTLHVSSDVIGSLYTTYDSGGSHTGTPSDGSAVQVWDDLGDGIADVILRMNAASSTEPAYRSTTPLMANPALDFVTNDHMFTRNQNGTANVVASSFFTASAWTVAAAFYLEGVTANCTGASYSGHTIVSANDYLGLSVCSNAGTPTIEAHNYDGTDDSVGVAIATDRSYVAIGRLSGGNIELRVIADDCGTTDGTPAASGNTSSLTGVVNIGAGGTALNGRIGELAFYSAALTGSNLTDLGSGLASTWLGCGGAVTTPRMTLLGVGDTQ